MNSLFCSLTIHLSKDKLCFCQSVDTTTLILCQGAKKQSVGDDLRIPTSVINFLYRKLFRFICSLFCYFLRRYFHYLQKFRVLGDLGARSLEARGSKYGRCFWLSCHVKMSMGFFNWLNHGIKTNNIQLCNIVLKWYRLPSTYSTVQNVLYP